MTMKKVLLSLSLLAVSSLAAAQSTSCGGQLQPRCEINAPVDDATAAEDTARQAEITAKNTQLRGTLDNIDPDKFKWSFIPEIPTAECVNPQVSAPNNGGTYEMDVCSKFYIFQKFINGVLAFFCLIGCVRQVQAALATK